MNGHVEAFPDAGCAYCPRMTLTLEIPDAVLSALELDGLTVEADARLELALAWYRRGVLSAGKASELAGISRMAFERLLAEREIERPFDLKELDKEITASRG